MRKKDLIKIPERTEIPEKDKWSLAKLFKDEKAWEQGLKDFIKLIPGTEEFKGTLGTSAESLKTCLDFMTDLYLLEERLGYYAHLKTSEDAGNSKNQERFSRYLAVASKAQALASYQVPEIQAIPDDKMNGFLKDETLKDFVIFLNKILWFKPHILSEKEEKLLALQTEANQTAEKTFTALTDADLDFGTIETPEEIKPLSQSTYISFLISPDRNIRKKAYIQFYNIFEKHKNSLSSLYCGSVHLDIYKSKIRNYPSARSAALFPDKVPESVYDNLVSTVNNNLSVLHEYYRLRRDVLNVDKLHLYDVYVPLIKEIQVKHTYEEAVDITISALAPLGEEYCSKLKTGLSDRWVDRYENKGKKSGAFSAGSYTGDPYILLNYKDDVLNHLFTLVHEAGHSMHSYYSSGNNPFQHYNYTIFEAEVASTFNEQLLSKYMLERADSDDMKAYLIGKQVDDIIGTIFRQTMFAEYEALTHSMVESGRPLTVESLRTEYRGLLKKYFGSDVALENVSDLEGLRIPHFYNAFYVYKYATGLSAGIALSQKVLAGDNKDKQNYLNFLKSGGSRYPLESLKLAGVDMSRPEPIEEALKKFQSLVSQLKVLLEAKQKE